MEDRKPNSTTDAQTLDAGIEQGQHDLRTQLAELDELTTRTTAAVAAARECAERTHGLVRYRRRRSSTAITQPVDDERVSAIHARHSVGDATQDDVGYLLGILAARGVL